MSGIWSCATAYAPCRPTTMNLNLLGFLLLRTIRILTIPSTPAGFRYRQRVWALLPFHPVPPGITAS